MENKLYRSTRDSKLMGLCAGLGELLNINVTFIRCMFAICVLFSGFTLLIAYFIIALFIPKEPQPYYGSYNFGYSANQACYEQNYYQSNGFNSYSMMEDIEKKSMQYEIQQLREKIAKIEKGE
jgi:phage shock protein C